MAVAGLVERLERKVRRHIMATMPADPNCPIDGQSLSSLLIDYRVWRGRFVEPRPRTVHRSRELAASLEATEYRRALEALEGKIEAGTDLTG
jgi:hypothetical protein